MSTFNFHIEKIDLVPETGFSGVLTLLKGNKLAAKDVSGKSDPYVIITSNSTTIETTKTKTKSQTLNPLWSHETPIITWSEAVCSNYIIDYNIFDYDTVGKDDPMGKVTITYDKLKRLVGTKSEFDMTVEPQVSEKVAGTVTFLFQGKFDQQYYCFEFCDFTSKEVLGTETFSFDEDFTLSSNDIESNPYFHVYLLKGERKISRGIAPINIEELNNIESTGTIQLDFRAGDEKEATITCELVVEKVQR